MKTPTSLKNDTIIDNPKIIKFLTHDYFDANKANICFERYLIPHFHKVWKENPVRISHPNKGSLVGPDTLMETVITDIWLRLFDKEGLKITLTDWEHMSPNARRSFLKRVFKNQAFDSIDLGHSNGSYRINSKTGERRRPRIHKTNTLKNEFGESIDVPLTGETTPLMTVLNEESKSIEHCTKNTLIAILTYAVDNPKTIYCFPKVTPNSVCKLLMYWSATVLTDQKHLNSPWLIILQKWWKNTSYTNQQLNRWVTNLPLIQQILQSQTGHQPKTIKEFIIRSLDITNSDCQAPIPTIQRESLRRSLGHIKAGMSFMVLATLLNYAPKSGYRQHFTELAEIILEKSVSINSSTQNLERIQHLKKELSSIILENTPAKKSILRPIFSSIMYDKNPEQLTCRVHNTLKLITHQANVLAVAIETDLRTMPITCNHT